MPEGPVVTDAVLVRHNPVGVEELRLVPFSEVPVEAHRRNRQIGPAVADGEVAEVDVSRPHTVRRDLRVRCAGVAVHDDRRVDGWSHPSEGGCRPTQTCPVHSAGKSSMGMAWIARSPAAIARIASFRRARHWSPTAGPPGTPSVSNHCASRSVPKRTPRRRCRAISMPDVRAQARGRTGRPRVPLQIPVADAERETVQFIPPDELGLTATGEGPCDLRDLETLHGVHSCQVGELRIWHHPAVMRTVLPSGSSTMHNTHQSRTGTVRGARGDRPSSLREQGVDRLVAIDEELEHDPR